MLRHINTTEGSIVRWYPNVNAPVLILRATFWCGYAWYTLTSIDGLTVLEFFIYDNGERINLTNDVRNGIGNVLSREGNRND